jgi:hypothetical protein
MTDGAAAEAEGYASSPRDLIRGLTPGQVPPGQDVEANRERWVDEWTRIVLR